MDEEKIGYKSFIGYRIQHNNDKGPFKGGVRFHKDLDLRMLLVLALEMTIKVLLLKLPLGGGKGGVRIDPRKYTPEELSRVMRAYVRGLLANKAVGIKIDVPAPDMDTGYLMAVFADELIRQEVMKDNQEAKKNDNHEENDNKEVRRRFRSLRHLSRSYALTDRKKWARADLDYPGAGMATPYYDMYLTFQNNLRGDAASLHGAVTGKPAGKGGLPAREWATGLGVTIATREAVHHYWNRSLERIARGNPSGFGNVGYWTAREMEREGATIVADRRHRRRRGKSGRLKHQGSF